ncbi:MAG: glycerophosphodiester phosphodiesterase [Bacteroidota bacterium]
MLALLLALAVAPDTVLVIAHRGASGHRPEHTLEAYRLAVDQGADVIEPDLVSTADGVLVARHENEISGTTDVASRPELADRRTTKIIDGEEVTGWFTEDLTLAELKTLRAIERLPDLRSTAYDGQFEVPTLDEVLALAREMGEARGRPVGLYPETKHPSYFREIGLPLEEPLLAALHGAGYTSREAPVWIQSFEVENLRQLREATDLRLVQLAYPGGSPADRPDLTYDAMVTPDGLTEIATYADAIGVHKAMVLNLETAAPTELVGSAHAAGLHVHVWTIRAENVFLLPPFRTGDDAAHGDLSGEVRALAEAGVDGLFSDHPDLVLAALGR